MTEYKKKLDKKSLLEWIRSIQKGLNEINNELIDLKNVLEEGLF